MDDQSLLAMRAVGMSTAEIAWTLKWTEDHVDRRYDELRTRMVKSALGLQLAGAALGCKIFQPDANPVRKVEPPRMGPPRNPGEAMVLRTFHLWGGGYGAITLLADGRRMFTECGPVRPELEQLIAVEPGDGCHRIVTQQKARAA